MPDTEAVKEVQPSPRGRETRNESRRRLWEALKEHGPTTTAHLALLTGHPLRMVCQHVSCMVAIGVLTVLSSGRGGHRYAALDDTYEDALERRAVRRPLERAKKYARRFEEQSSATGDSVPVSSPHNQSANLPRELDHFTVAQLRALRDTLNNLFSDHGPEK